MPETAVYKDRLFAARVDKIRLTGKLLAVEAVPVAEPMREFTHHHLGLHALRPDGSHVLRAPLFGDGIGHRPLHCQVEREVRYVTQPLAVHHCSQLVGGQFICGVSFDQLFHGVLKFRERKMVDAI